MVQDLFKALTATKLKANMNQAKDKMEITLSLTPKNAGDGLADGIKSIYASFT